MSGIGNIVSPGKQAGSMAVTIYDISRSLNLSAMTVSRVLNHRNADSVAPATRDRVEQAAREMGYRPNNNARALVTGRTNTIAVWISHVGSSVYAQIVAACRSAVQSTGMEISVVEMDWHFAGPNSRRRFPWPVDGIIAVDPPSPESMVDLLGSGPWETAPRVHIGTGSEVYWEGDFVHIDMGAGARAGVEHLVSLGCQRIAYSTPRFLARAGLGHYDAYIQSLGAAGLTPEVIGHDEWTLPAVRRMTRAYIEEHGAPDGLFCHHDEIAIASFRALRDLGLRIPDDIAIIGCEGNEFLEYFDPPISTVAMPIAALCQVGWDLLQRRIEDPVAVADQRTLPFELLVRESARFGAARSAV